MVSDSSHLPKTTYSRAPGIEVVPVPDGYVVYDDERSMVHYLNPSAAMVLELCQVSSDAAAIVRRMQDLFQLPAQPDVDVDSCISQLLEQGLILRNQDAGMHPV